MAISNRLIIYAQIAALTQNHVYSQVLRYNLPRTAYKHSEEFKATAAKLSYIPGAAIKYVAAELKVLRRMKRDYERLKPEHDLLKKSIAFTSERKVTSFRK